MKKYMNSIYQVKNKYYQKTISRISIVQQAQCLTKSILKNLTRVVQSSIKMMTMMAVRHQRISQLVLLTNSIVIFLVVIKTNLQLLKMKKTKEVQSGTKRYHNKVLKAALTTIVITMEITKSSMLYLKINSLWTDHAPCCNHHHIQLDQVTFLA